MDGGILITTCALFGLMFGFGLFVGLRSKGGPTAKLEQLLKEVEKDAAEVRAQVAEVEAISDGEQAKIRAFSTRIREIGEKARLLIPADAPGRTDLDTDVDSTIVDLDRWADEYRDSIEGAKTQRDNHQVELVRREMLERQVSNANWEWWIFIFGSITASAIALMRILISGTTGASAPWDATVLTAVGVTFGVFARGARRSYATAMAMADNAIRRDDIDEPPRGLQTGLAERRRTRAPSCDRSAVGECNPRLRFRAARVQSGAACRSKTNDNESSR